MESAKKQPMTLREKYDSVAGFILLAAIMLGFMAGASDQGDSIGPAAFLVNKELLYKTGVFAAPIGLFTFIVLTVLADKLVPEKGRAKAPRSFHPRRCAPLLAILGAMMVLGYTGNLLYGLGVAVVGLSIIKCINCLKPLGDPNADVNDPKLTKEFDELGLTVIGEATPMYDTVGDGIFDGLRTRLTRSEDISDDGDMPCYLYTVQVESSIENLRLVIRKAHSQITLPKELSAVTSTSSMQLNDVAVVSDDPSRASQLIADNLQAINTLMDWAEFLSINVESKRYARDEFFEGAGLLTLDQDSTKPDANPDLRQLISRLTELSKTIN